MEKRNENTRNERSPDASLVEALQSLAADMSRASTDSEAAEGLKRLKQIRASFLGGSDSSSVNAARRDAEALIAWVEARLEQLHQRLARKRRAQEGEAMEQIAKQREAEGPSLLPSELIEAVVRTTKEAEKDKSDRELPESASAPETRSPAKARPKKKSEGRKSAKEPAETATKETPAGAPTPPDGKPETRKPAETPAEAPRSMEKKPAESRPAPAQKPDWTKSEQLAAHLAASVREDPGFFEKLRKAAMRSGPRQKAPEDNVAAERYYRTIHGLNKRLVNLELHAKALARTEETREPVSPLLRTAARELKQFMRELKDGKAAFPGMAGEMERLFGGWSEQFAAMRPEKGVGLLEKCQAEREPAHQAAPERPAPAKAAEPDAPQLVLKRDDYRDQ